MKSQLSTCSLMFAASFMMTGVGSVQAANYFSDGDIYRGAGVKLYSVGEVDPVKPNGFRIPAITSAGNGILISAADVRYMGTGWSDLVAGTNIRKVKISTKVSFDGGKSWSDLQVLNAASGYGANDYMSLATDPALVYDFNHDTALMFGLRNNVNLNTGFQFNGDQNNPPASQGNPDNVDNIPAIGQHKPDFIMFSSQDKGLTWSTRSIYNEVYDQVNKGNGNGSKYSIIFQGPGGGMLYQDKIYVPIQAWSTAKDNGTTDAPKFVATSGFMVTEDGGKTWKVSSMLIPNVDDKLAGNDSTLKSSESNIFHYQGKIRLAVRNEESAKNPANNDGVKLRLVYEYDEKTDSWHEVIEDFIPHNVAQVETSSHNLSEDVYLVGYTSYYNYNFDGNPDRRKGQYLITNTGIKLLLSDMVSEGYTSVTHDEDNIYVMYEGKIDQHDIFFKAIDWKHKEYANLNTQILRRAHTTNYFQEQFANNSNYVLGKANTAGANIELMAAKNGFKAGVFVKYQDELDNDFIDALEYKNTDFAGLLGYEALFGEQAKANFMLGFMHSNLDYDNGSENTVKSILGGLQFDYDFGPVSYRGALNLVFSQNDLERNNKKGLGKTADFDSHSISIINELGTDFEFNQIGSLGLTAGLNNVFFSHEGFREQGGEGIGEGGQVGANNAHFGSDNLNSHELYVKADFKSQDFALNDNTKLSFNGDIKYAIDLADSDKWNPTYRTMSVERTYRDIGELYAAEDGGYLKAHAGVAFTFYESFNLGLNASIDSLGDLNGGIDLSYRF